MKSLRTFLAVSACACLLSLLPLASACGGETVNNGGKGNVQSVENGVVFVASEEVMDITETTTLRQYMDAMAENGGIEYEADNGMITSVNGIEPQSDNEYWFIYTSLGDYSNTEWGTYEYEGQTLGSATLGFGDLPCVEGETYALIISAY